jgi:hypothetical protein
MTVILSDGWDPREDSETNREDGVDVRESSLHPRERSLATIEDVRDHPR